MIIKNIKLLNWKNFQYCDVNLSERCFITGANASGKSNLIDAVRFLRDICKQSGGLQSAVSERGGITKIRSLTAQTSTNVAITVELGNPNQKENIWRYHVDFSHSGDDIIKNQVKINAEEVYSIKDSRFVLKRDSNSENEDAETLKFTHLEQPAANRNFSELQTFFQEIEYLNLIPQMVRESTTGISNSFCRDDYYGRYFLERLSKMNEDTRNSYFRKINDCLNVAVPQFEKLNFVKDKNGNPHLEAHYKHWRNKDSKQQETQFSDGTLRLIGFLFALAGNNGIILFEEPEINLHPGVIAQIPEFISTIQRTKKVRENSQILITTHSYDMLANAGISSDEVLLLRYTQNGTEIIQVSEIPEIKAIVDAGLNMADAVLPFTKPENIENLSQFATFF